MAIRTATFELLENISLRGMKDGHAEGTHGTIVDAYPAADSYTVELFDSAGETLDVIVCRADELTPRNLAQ